jgi:hypothetical protein
MSTSPPAVRSVSRFEANLLRILRCIVQHTPAEQVLPLVQGRLPRPNCLSRSAIELIQDTLAKGCVLYLVRAGGWRVERFLRTDRTATGRLWERTSPERCALAFSGQSIDFLMWLTSARPSDSKPAWEVTTATLTPADQLLLFLAYDTLRRHEVGPDLRVRPAFAENALCRLAFPEDFARPNPLPVPDFRRWFTGLGALILEALQRPLRQYWLAGERAKRQVTVWDDLRHIGTEQEAIYSAFLQTADQAQRRDLTRFLLEGLDLLLRGDPPLTQWTGGLQATAPPRLADRIETQRRGLAPLRLLDTLKQWEQRARTVRHFDEEYAAAQLWLSDWERCDGNTAQTRAHALLRQVEPMRMQQAN